MHRPIKGSSHPTWLPARLPSPDTACWSQSTLSHCDVTTGIQATATACSLLTIHRSSLRTFSTLRPSKSDEKRDGPTFLLSLWWGTIYRQDSAISSGTACLFQADLSIPHGTPQTYLIVQKHGHQPHTIPLQADLFETVVRLLECHAYVNLGMLSSGWPTRITGIDYTS